MNVKKALNFVQTGLLSEFAPGIIKGILIELFKGVSIDEATDWVERNKSLWGNLSPEYQAQIRRLGKKIGSLDYIDADWGLDAFRKELPALASLFLGWRKGYNWLERQLTQIKEEIKRKA